MVSWLTLRCTVKIPRHSPLVLHGSRFYGTKLSKPLRILFCGSDDFSSASLRALHAERERNPQLIESIDVLCRPGKPSGRSLKNIREGIEDFEQQESRIDHCQFQSKLLHRSWHFPSMREIHLQAGMLVFLYWYFNSL